MTKQIEERIKPQMTWFLKISKRDFVITEPIRLRDEGIDLIYSRFFIVGHTSGGERKDTIH
jgi:hypothetical protein